MVLEAVYEQDFLPCSYGFRVVRRMIDKWLNAGVLETGSLQFATEGTPQGGVITP
jgi:retron-type reverse transcriptase